MGVSNACQTCGCSNINPQHTDCQNKVAVETRSLLLVRRAAGVHQPTSVRCCFDDLFEKTQIVDQSIIYMALGVVLSTTNSTISAHGEIPYLDNFRQRSRLLLGRASPLNTCPESMHFSACFSSRFFLRVFDEFLSNE